MSAPEQPFAMPILSRTESTGPVTFTPSDADRRQARFNHSQTLERLRERGGLSWCELAAVLEHRDWRRMPPAEAEEAVKAELLRRVGA